MGGGGFAHNEHKVSSVIPASPICSPNSKASPDAEANQDATQCGSPSRWTKHMLRY